MRRGNRRRKGENWWYSTFMKTFFLIIDGLGDDPIPTLNALTPLEAADAPLLQALACHARKGFL